MGDEDGWQSTGMRVAMLKMKRDERDDVIGAYPKQEQWKSNMEAAVGEAFSATSRQGA
jgi:hypothetical protein